MPFSGIFQLNHEMISVQDHVTFLEYCGSNFHKFHDDFAAIASVDFNGKRGQILSTFPCYFSEVGDLKLGDSIVSDTKIATFNADGESIPYKLPYAMIKTERNKVTTLVTRQRYLGRVRKLISSIDELSRSLEFEAPTEDSRSYYDYPRRELQWLNEELKKHFELEDYIRGTMVIHQIKKNVTSIGASSTKGEIQIHRPELLELIHSNLYVFQETEFSNVNWKTI